jgi:hypothetical protein
VFCPLKWAIPRIARNYAATGVADIQQRTRRVTPASDVTVRVKVVTNTGITMAAGVVPGARLGRPGVLIDGRRGREFLGSSRNRLHHVGFAIKKRRSEGEWPE